MSATPAYDALKAHRLRVHRLEHLQAIASWDRLTYMPPGGAAARAAAQGELAATIQQLRADPAGDALVADATAEPLDAQDAANLALIDRERRIAGAVPEALTKRLAEAAGAATAVWARARADGDWPAFAAALDPLLAATRERADRIGQVLGLARYDVLLDEFDRGLTRARVDALFGEIAGWLPGLIGEITARQADEPAIAPVGPFPADGQRAMCVRAMTLLGFDFDGGRLDVSLHPFTGGVSEDVRLTTRFRDDDCLTGLLGIMHETGHARYQAGLPAAWRGQPLGEACSAAMHEAQALSFERQLARSPVVAAHLAGELAAAFGAQPAFAPDNVLRLLTRVRPGAIRVEADEVTYAAHILLRFEIETALIDGTLDTAGVPTAWDDAMAAMLGVDTRGDPARGALQDIHWASGMFGYFPSYLIGAMIAAQLAAAFDAGRDGAGEDAATRAAAFGDWLAQRIWSRGAALPTEELVREATGAPLAPEALRAHFRRRYLAA